MSVLTATSIAADSTTSLCATYDETGLLIDTISPATPMPESKYRALVEIRTAILDTLEDRHPDEFYAWVDDEGMMAATASEMFGDVA